MNIPTVAVQSNLPISSCSKLNWIKIGIAVDLSSRHHHQQVRLQKEGGRENEFSIAVFLHISNCEQPNLPVILVLKLKGFLHGKWNWAEVFLTNKVSIHYHSFSPKSFPSFIKNTKYIDVDCLRVLKNWDNSESWKRN